MESDLKRDFYSFIFNSYSAAHPFKRFYCWEMNVFYYNNTCLMSLSGLGCKQQQQQCRGADVKQQKM